MTGPERDECPPPTPGSDTRHGRRLTSTKSELQSRPSSFSRTLQLPDTSSLFFFSLFSPSRQTRGLLPCRGGGEGGTRLKTRGRRRESPQSRYLFAVSAVKAAVRVDSCPRRHGEQHSSSALTTGARAQPRLPADVSSWGSASLESRCLTESGAAAAAGRGLRVDPPPPPPPPPQGSRVPPPGRVRAERI